MDGMSELFSFQWARDGGPVSLQEAGFRLILAIVLSAGVGIDRELKNKPLGLRTNMLVALRCRSRAPSSRPACAPRSSKSRRAAAPTPSRIS